MVISLEAMMVGEIVPVMNLVVIKQMVEVLPQEVVGNKIVGEKSD